MDKQRRKVESFHILLNNLPILLTLTLTLAILIPVSVSVSVGSGSILDNCETIRDGGSYGHGFGHSHSSHGHSHNHGHGTVQQQQTNDMSLSCHLRTINSEFDRTNLSELPGDLVTSLRLDCSDILFYQSSLEKSSLAHLTRLTSLHIEHCKLSRLPPGVFSGLISLRNLTVRTHNTAWPALSLDIAPGVFTGLNRLEKMDLSANNIWTFPSNSFCATTSLRVLNVGQNRLQDLSALSFSDSQGQGSRTGKSHPHPLSVSSSSSSFGGCHTMKLGIEVLDVSNNRLILLPPNGLTKLTLLQELYLQGNEITIVSAQAFLQLKQLKLVHLADNKIETLPADLFQENRDIAEIYLQNNSLTTISPGLFTELSQLVILDLSRNKLTSHGLQMLIKENLSKSNNSNLTTTTNDSGNSSSSSFTFSGLIRLVNLNLSYNKLQGLEPSLFHDLFSLQILNLEFNEIASIQGDTFMALKNLHTLTLSNNKLTFIDSTTFNGLFVLTFLSLDHNLIEEIHPRAFHNNSNVRDINLNGNAFTKVPLAIQNLTFLKTLDLGENSIDSLDTVRLIGLPNLYGLRLTGNQIVNVSSTIFRELPSLKVVNLARNQIHAVEAGAFDGNTNLQAVRLDANYLVDISSLFSSLPNLLWLNVSDNRLSWFDYTLIPSQLMWLDLHRNQISALENIYGRTEFRLQTLDASFNRLTSISPPNIPDSVENLYLNDNLISMIEPNSFYRKANLTRVDLFMNQLQTLELAAFQLSLSSGRNLPEFYMAGNPLVCDCHLEWLPKINQLSSLRQHPVIMDLDNLYCQLPYHPNRPNGHENQNKEGQGLELELEDEVRNNNNNNDGERESLSLTLTSGLNGNEDDDFALSSGSSSSSSSSAPIVLPISEVSPDQFLCPYKTHCFNLCHCCDFEACDCQMTCPVGCQCYHDKDWSVNIVDCSASSVSIESTPRKTIPASIPMDSTQLHLDGHKLNYLPSHVFIGRKNLESLFLNDSGIDTIMNNSFSGLRRLTSLHLQDNYLREILGFEFEPLENLRQLFLHNNHISFIGTEALSHLKKLEVLTLTGNRLTHFPIWSLSWNPYLSAISLDGNPWSCDCDFVAHALPWIQSNLIKLTSTTSGNLAHFDGTGTRTSGSSKLKLLANKATGIGATGTVNGRVNDLAMGSIDPPSSPTQGNTNPNINMNIQINLNCVQSSTGKSWPLLSMNATYCSSENGISSSSSSSANSNARNNQNQQNQQHGSGGSGSGTGSRTPSGSSHTNKEVTANNSEEENDNDIFPYLPSLLAIGAVLLFVSTVFLAVCRHRNKCLGGRITEQCVQQCYDLNSNCDKDMDDQEKLFDAYIAYSVKDEAWVSQILAPNLQNQNQSTYEHERENGNGNENPQNYEPYRLCLHYRDFALTSYIADTIVEAVDSSRRTVIVLSKNFLQSEWCSYEFKSALHTAVRSTASAGVDMDDQDGHGHGHGGNGGSGSKKKQKNKLIIVTLGDITTRDLDPDLRVMLRNATVLQANDKQFWGRLKSCMPEPRPLPLTGLPTWKRNQHLQLQHSQPHMAMTMAMNGNNMNSLSNTNSKSISQNQSKIPSVVPCYYDISERTSSLNSSSCHSNSISSNWYQPPPPLPPGGHVHLQYPQPQLHSPCTQIQTTFQQPQSHFHLQSHLQHPHLLPPHSQLQDDFNGTNLQPILDNFHNVQCNQMIMSQRISDLQLQLDLDKTQYSYVEST